LRTTLTVASIVLLLAATAVAADRPPIKDRGDVATTDKDNLFIGAITAQGGACTNARSIARTVARSARCKSRGSCSAAFAPTPACSPRRARN